MAQFEIYFPSTWRRLMAHFLDRAYITVLQSPVWLSIGMVYFKTNHFRISWPHLTYLVFVSLFYEILSLYFFSTTLGKWQWNLFVKSRDGEPDISFDQAIIRVLVSRLSVFLGWAIFALAFFNCNRTHLADWVAETQVVSKKARSRHPKKRWLVGFVFFFLSGREAIRTSSMAMSSATWQQPFVYFQSSDLKKWIEHIEFSIHTDDEDSDD